MATKTHSYGTYLAYGTDGVNYTNIADIKDADAGETDVSDAEVTHLLSSNGHKEYIPGLAEGGEATFQLYMGKAQLNTLYGLVRTSGLYWKIYFPLISGEANNTTWVFNGHIKKLGRGKAGQDEVIMCPMTVKVTGKPTFTPGT